MAVLFSVCFFKALVTFFNNDLDAYGLDSNLTLNKKHSDSIMRLHYSRKNGLY